MIMDVMLERQYLLSTSGTHTIIVFLRGWAGEDVGRGFFFGGGGL